MKRLSRTAVLLACCTPAGLLLGGCGQPDRGPSPLALQPGALQPVQPVAKPLPPLRVPRLLPDGGEVRPVAGDWQDGSPDAAFRQSERHLQGNPADLPQRIAGPDAAASIAPAAPNGRVEVRPSNQPSRPALPTQVGPYPLERPQPIREPAAAPPVAPPPYSPAPQFSPAPQYAPPTFTGASVAPPSEQPPAFRPVPTMAPPMGPVAGPPRDRSGFRAVSDRIHGLNYQAVNLANRGALHAAREDLIQSLRLATQSLDAADGTNAYSQALNQGMTALSEAEDFALHGAAATAPIEIAPIIAGHRTPVLQGLTDQEISPVIAMQRYYGYAGDRLTFAAGDLPAAADTLFWLGKVHNSLAQQNAQADRLQGPQAMVCFRAALSAAPQHYLAANELGVLLARYGQLHDAKRLLQQSVNTRPHAEGWQNLVVVHKRLGETQLATLAEQEFVALGGRTTSNQPGVKWLDPQAFAATGGQSPTWEQPTQPTQSAYSQQKPAYSQQQHSNGPVATQPRASGARR